MDLAQVRGKRDRRVSFVIDVHRSRRSEGDRRVRPFFAAVMGCLRRNMTARRLIEIAAVMTVWRKNGLENLEWRYGSYVWPRRSSRPSVWRRMTGQVRPLPLQVMHTFLPLQVGQVSLKNPVFPDPPQFGHRPFPLQVEQTPMEHFPEAVAA